MNELKPCPFCGGEAKVFHYSSAIRDEVWRAVCDKPFCAQGPDGYTEAEAVAAWNSRAAIEFDNWFYLPKPKEQIVEVTETTHAWDGTKVKTDVFYQVQEQAVINWAKELDEHIIKRICEVWNSRAERTCEMETDHDELEVIAYSHEDTWAYKCSACDWSFRYDRGIKPNYCPNCGAKVVSE